MIDYGRGTASSLRTTVYQVYGSGGPFRGVRRGERSARDGDETLERSHHLLLRLVVPVRLVHLYLGTIGAVLFVADRAIVCHDSAPRSSMIWEHVCIGSSVNQSVHARLGLVARTGMVHELSSL